MSAWPTTDALLLHHLSDPSNHDAWQRFDTIYRPTVYRFARRSGIKHHDAEEIAAEALRRVARAAVRWSTDRPPDQFAAWLTRVSKNALLNLVCRELTKRGTGGTTHQLNLLERPSPTELSQTRWAEDHRREIVRHAAGRIRDDFDIDSWTAFWRTHVDGDSIVDVAADLGKTPGAIYAVRSRIVRRLREEVRSIEAEESSQ
ncbi:MAG: sigma-70 family RNA polymerase sigma factor [Pirellulaceae bacterium]